MWCFVITSRKQIQNLEESKEILKSRDKKIRDIGEFDLDHLEH